MAGSMPSFAEVQQVLDDPNVDSDLKHDVALNYFSNAMDEDPQTCGFEGENHRDRMMGHYVDKLDISPTEILSSGGYIEDVAHGVKWVAAKTQYDENRKDERDNHKQAIDDAKGRLKELNDRASETDASVANSNEILDAAVPGLDVFGTFIPVYSRARAVVAQNLPDLRYPQDILEWYDEQRDISFSKFGAASQEFIDVRESLVDAAGTQNNGMNTALANWDGQAKEAAAQSWGKMSGGAEQVEQTLNGAADAINRTTASVAESCRAKADWVLNFSFQEFPVQGQMSAQDIDRLILVAQLGRNASDDDFKHFTRFMPEDVTRAVQGDKCDLSDEVKDQGQSWAKQWLVGFCEWFNSHVNNFHQMCENTRQAVATAWSELGNHLQDAPDDLFADVGEGGQAAPAHEPGQGPQQQGQGEPPANDPPATNAAGANTPQQAPAAEAPATSGAPAAAPTGESAGSPAASSAATGASATEPPGQAAVTGAAMPATAPAVPSADGSPAQATSDMPGAMSGTGSLPGESGPMGPQGQSGQGQGANPEQLTMEKGAHKLALNRPGADGSMGVSLDDGSGQPKGYPLQFGGGGGPMAGAAEPASPEPGVEGAEGDDPFRPGEDGKIHIQVGELEITAEQPEGPEGPAKITLDDGNGEPTTLTVDVSTGDGEQGGELSPSGDDQNATPAASPGEGGRHRAIDTELDAVAEGGDSAAPTAAPTSSLGETMSSPDARASPGPGAGLPGDTGFSASDTGSAGDTPLGPGEGGQPATGAASPATASSSGSGAEFATGVDQGGGTTVPQAVGDLGAVFGDSGSASGELGDTSSVTNAPGAAGPMPSPAGLGSTPEGGDESAEQQAMGAGAGGGLFDIGAGTAGRISGSIGPGEQRGR